MSARRSVAMVLVWLCGAAGGLLLWSAPAVAQRMHAFSSSFGGEGSGPGQFMRPGAMAVNDATGDVYVIDQGNGRVEVFSSTGTYISQLTPPTGPFKFPVSEPGHETAAGTIAVDDSTNPLDPSAGDVYVVNADEGVVDKFSAGGTYLGEFTDHRTVFGIAVAPNGSVWLEGDGLFYEFNDANANELISDAISTSNYPQEPGKGSGSDAGTIGMAIDSEGNLYTGKRDFGGFPGEIAAKFTSSGQLISDVFDVEETLAFAVDRSSNDEYVDNITSIAAFGPTSSPIERFGSSQLSESEGVAVNSATGTVYASDAATQKVYIFTAFVVPDVSTGSVSSLGEASATVSGVVDPDGLPVSSCVFEYGATTAYGQEKECSVNPGSGDAPVAVSANLSGLERLTTYHFRLRVANANGSGAGLDGFFATPEPVAVSEEAVSDVSAGGALFGAVVDPEDSDTTFHFEYGTSVAYGESAPVPDGELGGGTVGEGVSVRVEDLLAGTTYHVRLVASNALGVVYGPDVTFTTEEGGGAFALIDGREWEMVSPPEKSGAAVEPPGRSNIELGLVQASEDGSAISYFANGPFSGGVPSNSTPQIVEQMLSRRGGGGSGPGGWVTEEISPSHNSDVNVGAGVNFEPEDRMFSGDLSSALVDPAGRGLPLLSPLATEPTVYLRDDATGSYLPLVTAGNVLPGVKFAAPASGGEIGIEDVYPIGATPDLSHVLLSSQFALTENAKQAPRGCDSDNIYEWSGGRLKLVNVAENGEWTSCAGLGGEPDRGTISDDGSKVFWQAGGSLYMRETVAERTVQLGSGGFQIANADGSMVFFTREGNLYVADTLTGVTTDLTGAAGGVQGQVLGISEDGSIVYFVATGVLGGEGEEGQPNLYVASETGSGWSTRLVAVLSKEDLADWQVYEFGGGGGVARVAPNGKFVAFMSDRSLTGYDNRDANSRAPDEEVFLYDDASNHLVCASCNPTGERPTGTYDLAESLTDRGHVWTGRWLAADIPRPPVVGSDGAEGSLGVGFRPHQLRDLSDEGRLFFNGFDSLVPRATNGRANVYEFEPDGLGSCVQVAGCVGLVSSGTSSEESLFMDASESGDDVFFLTTAKLVPQALENNLSMYDAHVCSAAQPCLPVAVLPPACSSGDACKAAPSPQPAIFGAPASATFSGTGNLPPAPAVKAKAKPAKCRKGFVERGGRCVKKSKPRRKRTGTVRSGRGGKK